MATTKTPPEVDAPTNGKVEEPEPLDLVGESLTPTRRLVKIPTKRKPEGETFEMHLVEDFGIEDQQKLMAWSRRFSQLMGADEELTKAEQERLRFLLTSLVDMVLDAPKTVKDTLKDSVANRVVQTFSWGPALARQDQQTELVKRLIEKGHLTQEQVDETQTEIRQRLLESISGS